jgi:hypothetical protein
MDMTTSLILAIALDPGNLEDLVGKRSSDLVGGGNVGVLRQLPEDPREIKARIAMSNFEQHPIYNFARKLPGFIGK